MMLNIFSCVSWPSVCPFWRSTYLGSLHFLIGLFGGFFGVEFYKFFINFGYQDLIRYIGKYVFPFSGLSFILLMVFFAVQKLLRKNEVGEIMLPDIKLDYKVIVIKNSMVPA